MNRVVKILMKRDKMSYEDAKEQVLLCKEALLEGDENAIMDYLCLEDDYMEEILNFR